MRNAWSLLLVLLMAAPVAAQETDYSEFGEPVSEDDSGVETYALDEPEPYDTTVPVEDEVEEPSDPIPLYAGVDFVTSTLSSSSLPGFGTQDFDSGLYRLKFGTNFFDNKVGLEFHYGLDRGGDAPGEAVHDSHYALYLVPRAKVLDTVELALLMGYAKNSVSQPGASADIDSVAYGLDLQLPLRLFWDNVPDIRFALGWMVYYQKEDARLYGANAGIRYDFTTRGLGVDFGRIGGWFSGLWPFGGDDEAEE